jgi:hypothetical protein
LKKWEWIPGRQRLIRFWIICEEFQPRVPEIGPPQRGDAYKQLTNGILEYWKNATMGIESGIGANLLPRPCHIF